MAKQMSNTDYTGRTLEQELDAARRAQARQDLADAGAQRRATVGRLFHTSRRWTWGFRWEEIGRTGRIELDRCVFEIVAQV